MSKKIAAGALSVAAALSAFAVLAVPTFAASESWNRVTVTPDSEFILTGSINSNTDLKPSISAIDKETAGALTVHANSPWKLQWQAVQGKDYTITPAECTGGVGADQATCEADGGTWVAEIKPGTTAALGTTLGTDGFTNGTGYTYAGANTEATTGSNNWGVKLAGNDVVATPPALGLTASTIATGTATTDSSITPTYSAGTLGNLGTASYYGTIYYTLSSNQ